ncbi:hypothetical protein EBQ90_06615 [bacterium]|nr:hypothetical protein [bacterium]
MKPHRLVALSWLVIEVVDPSEGLGKHITQPNNSPAQEERAEELPPQDQEQLDLYGQVVQEPQDPAQLKELLDAEPTDKLLELQETLEDQQEKKGELTEPQAQALAHVTETLNQRELQKVAGRSGIEGNKKIPIYKTENGIIRASFENGKPTQNAFTGKLDGNSYKSEKLPSGLVMSQDGRIFKGAAEAPLLSRGVSSPSQPLSKPQQPDPELAPAAPAVSAAPPVAKEPYAGPSEDAFQKLVDTRSVDGHFVLSASAEQLKNPELLNKLKETGLGWLAEPGNVLRLPANEATKNMMTQSGLEPFASDLIQSRESGQALLQKQLGMYPESTQDMLKNQYFTFKPSDRNYTMKYENSEGQDKTLPGQAHPGFKPASTLGSGDLWHVITANGVSGLKDLASSNQSTVDIWNPGEFASLSKRQSEDLLRVSGAAHFSTSPRELPLAVFDRAVKINLAESPLKPFFSFLSSK